MTDAVERLGKAPQHPSSNNPYCTATMLHYTSTVLHYTATVLHLTAPLLHYTALLLQYTATVLHYTALLLHYNTLQYTSLNYTAALQGCILFRQLEVQMCQTARWMSPVAASGMSAVAASGMSPVGLDTGHWTLDTGWTTHGHWTLARYWPDFWTNSWCNLKSRIRETPTLSTYADSSTNTMKCPLFGTFTHFLAFFSCNFCKNKKINKWIHKQKFPMSHVMCNVSCVMCHVSVVTNDNDQSHRPSSSNSSIIHSRRMHSRVAPKTRKCYKGEKLSKQ